MAFTMGMLATQADALVLSVDTGWTYDQLDASGSPTQGSPITFTLATSGVFSLTDAFVIGDTYTISGDFAGVSAIGTPGIAVTLGLGNTFFDTPFSGGLYSIFQIALAAGTYTISVTGDGLGGLPAGLGLRVDTSAVPLPGAAILLLTGLGAIGGLRLRRRKAA